MQRESTRTRILVAARTLLEEGGYHAVGMAEIARAAGVSRQAVYLHFGSKAALLLALVEWVDRSGPLGGMLESVRAARTGREALAALVHASAEYDPHILEIAAALDAARRTEPDAAAAWRDRMGRRRSTAAGVVGRLAGEGELAEGWRPAEAADFLWALLSPQARALLVERGWAPGRYEKLMLAVLERALLKPARARGRRPHARRGKAAAPEGPAPSV